MWSKNKERHEATPKFYAIFDLNDNTIHIIINYFMKKTLLFAAGFAALSFMQSRAQELSEGYLVWPESTGLPGYVTQWNGGSGSITINDQAWEDENFFISRVKPKIRFYNTATQVYPEITQYDPVTNPDGNDKRMLWWVPLSDEKRNGVNTNGLPNGLMDQEVFSMWSYMDHYGNWSSPWGWVPGVFADVAHKNGVAVSGVASVPWSSAGASWNNALTQFGSVDGTAVAKFLYYHGVDGLGYNSEWNGIAPRTYITPNHDKIAAFMADKNPIYENVWYGGTNDYGSITFDTGVHSNYANIFRNASMFLNYNWNSPSTIANSIKYAKDQNRNPFFIYAGHNMQGANPGYANFEQLVKYQYSIGLWGAHNVNMLWKDRNKQGSSTTAMQRTYVNMIEQWFGNGKRNPAIKQPLTVNKNHRPSEDWAGFSTMMSARSTYNWDLSEEPFISYFNLGNGMFFNWKGDRMNSNQWYNIGIQDYLPTWRWWFAPSFLQKDVEEGTVHLAADFTWDDAFVGGSCLQIAGTSEDEYLHLFKTDFNIKTGSTITVSYKLLEGQADVNIVMSATADPEKIVGEDAMSIMKVADADDDTDASYVEGADGWITKTIKPTAKILNSLKNGTAVIGLHFKNAENLKMLLGQFAIRSNASFSTPAMPKIKLAKVFVNNYKGIDGKLIWDMDHTKGVGEPVYNADVKTSMFRVWSQQEGCDAVMTGATTSWANIIFQAPYSPEGGNKVRFGVSALGIDNESESEIAWSDYMELPAYEGVDKIQLSKLVIKPNEEFTLSFIDPMHESGEWTISDPDTGEVLFTGEGTSVTCDGISRTGSFNVTVESNGKELSYPRFVPVSPMEVGALPQITELGFGEGAGSEDVTIDINDAQKFTYKGRQADGNISRGIDLNEGWFGVNVGEVGIQSNQSFSVAAWVKYDELPEDRSNFITIENRETGGWPYNNWGFFWSRITGEGKFVHDNIDTAWGMRVGSGTEGPRLFYRYDDAKIDLGAWTHVAVVFEYSTGSQMRQKFYINGVQQKVGAWIHIMKSTMENIVGSESGKWSDLELGFGSAYAYGSDTYEPEFIDNKRPLSSLDWIAFGGSSSGITATKGCVDDFQVWNKAMTTEEVVASMKGFDADNLPANVVGYWDLESDPITLTDGSIAISGKAGSAASKSAPNARWWPQNTGTGEGADKKVFKTSPQFLSGCPFISGTAYPIVTTPNWSVRGGTVTSATGNDTEGEASMTFRKAGDYSVQLTLENGHGTDSKTYPVVKVTDASAIGGIAADGDFSTYTIDDVLFVEFDADGVYNVEVYNMAGMLVGSKTADIVAGQNAQIGLGTAGVYLIKVTKDGKVLRTVKVIRK